MVMKKRFLLIGLMIANGVAVFAESFEIGKLKYVVTDADNQYVSVGKTSSNPKGALIIDSIIENAGVKYYVTSIEVDAFRNCKDLTSVHIPNSITVIGNNAFFGCSGLKSINIPNSVTEIGSSAFYWCSNLVDITIDSDADFTNSYLFLTKDGLYYKVLNKDNVSLNSNGLYSGDIEIPSSITIGDRFPVTSIGAEAFRECIDLSSIIIPEGIKSIGTSAFSGCSGLKSITIPNSVANIGNNAFFGCSKVESLTYNTDAIKSIFSGIRSLKNITIGDSVTIIGTNAFKGCSGMTSVILPNSIKSIGNNAFDGCTGLTLFTMGDSVLSIGDFAFSGCSNLTSLSISNSITEIGSCAFNNCGKIDYNVYDNGYYIGNESNPYVILISSKSKNITSCTINAGCRIIYEGAFEDCSNLIEIRIPESVVNIRTRAFAGCSGLQKADFASIESLCKIKFDITNANPLSCTHQLYVDGVEITNLVIPNTVASIGNYTFSECNKITSVSISESVTSIGDYAFAGCSGILSVSISESVRHIGYNAFAKCSSLKSVTIPNSVTSIDGGAFSGCTNLTSINIPDSINTINNAVFSGCNKLSSIIIPKTVTSIGQEAFCNCNSLTSVSIPNSVTSISKKAFYNCTSLMSAAIPNSVTSISNDAFQNSNNIKTLLFNTNKITYFNYEPLLERVIIGDSVKSINDNAFSSSTVLKDIISYAAIPPVLANGAPLNNVDTIYVRPNSVETYKTAAYWKQKEILPFYIALVTSANETFGTVQCDSFLLGGNAITIVATPKEGYHFAGWNDGAKENPRSLTATKDTSIIAIFEVHTAVTDSAVAATCTATGLTEGSHCSGCNEVFVAQTEIPMIAHTIVIDTAVTATCTATGLTEGSHCSVCNTVLVAQTEVPLAAHTIVIDPEVAATATETGLTEGSHCAVCGAVIVAQEVIPTLGEQGGNTNPGTAVAETAANVINIYSAGNTIFVENAKSEIRIYDSMGRLVATSNREDADIRICTAGVYIVKVGNITRRVMSNND